MNNTDDDISREEQLKRFIVRLSYVGMGIDKELDQHLRGLRKTIKKDDTIDAIRKAVDDIADRLVYMEEDIENAKGAQTKMVENLLANLTEGIASLDLGDEHNERVKGITSRIEATSPESAVEEVISLVEELMGKGSNTVIADNNSDREVTPSLQAALDDFVNQLSVVDFYNGAADRIRTALRPLKKVDHLPRAIEEIAAILLETVNQEHNEFEDFLQTLNKRILNVASFLNQASVGQEGFVRDSEKLDEELRKTIGDIKREINDTQGLGSLKQRLLGSFEHIFSSVSHFKEVQISRVNASISELKIVREQLEVTEEETAHLKEKLREQRIKALTDPLTGLPNRYAYNERLHHEYIRWKRYKTALSLTVFDIDYFKKVNDDHGHTVGDSILQELAKVVTAEIRESDFFARYGGEEFVILMPETNLAEAIKAINKLRLVIRDRQFQISDQLKLTVTISCGVSQFESNDDSHDVFQKADKALYRAKKKGRNQVCAERSTKVIG